jgi:hypothetical protein
MADHHQGTFTPNQTDVCHPNFSRNFARWAAEADSGMRETIIRTKRIIADSRALLAETDRVLASRRTKRSVSGSD